MSSPFPAYQEHSNAHDGGKLLAEAGVEGLADLCSLDIRRRQIIATLLLNYEGW
ncbi:hypothetical protein [Pseudomonas sp.]|uniref:hypothetical protein n=1 Tax=Pseudomonas sp. TaxID=306 RepID=UPI003C77878D